MGDSAVLSLSGDASAIRSSAVGWAGFANAAASAADDVRRVDSGDFTGDEADTYRDKMSADLPPHLETSSQAWTAVSSALHVYAAELEGLQQRMSALSAQADDQRSQAAAATTAAADARAADDRHLAAVDAQRTALPPGQALPADTYQSQSGVAATHLKEVNAAVQASTDAANQLHTEHDRAVDACVKAITTAAGLRFEEPPGFWGRLGNTVGGWIRDHEDVLTAISGALKQISSIAGVLAMIPILAPVMAPLAAASGAGSVLIDGALVAATGKGSMNSVLIDAAALLPGGRAVEGVTQGAKVLGEADAAVGAGKAMAAVGRDANAAGGVVGDVAGVETAAVGAGREGAGAVDSAASAVAHDTPVESLPCVGDPIDVVTGDMVMAHTDVHLPGVLPLTVRRVYKSGYRWGGVFGPSWASTLDQRVEVGADGAACFVAEDGVVLHYPAAPAARPGAARLPLHGIQRWPLRGDESGGWTVHDPERRVTRTFAPPDRNGRSAIIRIEDGHGNFIDFLYGTAGVLSEIRHCGGYRVLVASADGLVRALSVREGDDEIPVVSFDYDRSNMVRVYNAAGSPLTLHWESGRIAGWRDRNDIWYRYDYDEHHRCVRTSGRGRVLSYGFSYLPGRTLVTDSLGAVSTYEFNAAHQLTRTVDAQGNVTASVWDRYDRLLLRTDPLGRSTQFEYDDAGRLVASTYPDGTQELLQRNTNGDVVHRVDRIGAVWSYTYDAAGNPVSLRNPLGAVTSYSYSAAGAMESVADPLGRVTTVRSSAAGLPTSVSDPLGATTRVQYDGSGRIVRAVDAVGSVTGVGWTVDGRLSHRVGPDGAREEWTWDHEGNLTSHTQPTGARTVIQNGVFDLPVARTGPDGGRMLFGYDTELRLTSVQNPAGLRWTYEYDAVGQLVSETDFNGRRRRYHYDAAGQLTGIVNGLGEQVTLHYDIAGNLVRRTTIDGITELGYDGAGRLLTARSPGAVVEIDRDACGRVVAETVNGRRMAVEYDAAGGRVSRLTPAGVLSTWQSDAAGRADRLTTGAASIAFQYDLGGREIGRAFAGGGRLTQSFDASDRMVSQRLGPGISSTETVGRTFAYRADGVLTHIVDTIRGESRRFDLDVAGRVVAVRASEWTEGYAYDHSDQLTQTAFVAAPVHPTSAGQSTSAARTYHGTLVTRAGAVSYRHDRQGRVTSRSRRRLSQRPETWEFRYNGDDRMVEAVSGAERWTYVYDAFGRRISKQRLTAGGAVDQQTLFSWDGDRLIEQVRNAGDGVGPTITTWEYAPDSWTPMSQYVHGGEVDAQFYAIVSDLVGRPTELVTADGRQVVWTDADTTIWGAPRHAANAPSKYGIPRVDCPLRFPGQYADDETGLHYNRSRYYDPHVGRYTTSDPLGLAPADDPYGYVLNPTRWADPLGLTPCDPANLRGHESPTTGHTIKKHVGKSDAYLKGRGIPEASTFPDLATASRETKANLDRNAGGIRFWLTNMRGNRAEFSGTLNPGSGLTYVSALNTKVESTRIRTALIRASDRPEGYFIHTSFPEP